MSEGRTFLQVPSQNQGIQDVPPMGDMPPMNGPMGGQMGGPQDTGGMPFGQQDMGQGFPPGGGGESQFDTGFDAGVEADEDSDPKRYIQQLTGKLSQTLNTYNNEVGDDPELSKYVGKMIVKAASKGLDERGRKDLIRSINTTPESEEEEVGDVEDMEDVPQDGGEDVAMTKQQMMEMADLIKKNINGSKSKSPFYPKIFK